MHERMAGLAWESLRWSDKTTYEGVSKDNLAHGAGVAKFPDGSRYEGEWHNNRIQGFGSYIWNDNSIYRGEWEDNKMHGCGVWMKKEGSRIAASEGQFLNGRFIGPGLACPASSAQFAAGEADDAARKAKGFQLEPGWLS